MKYPRAYLRLITVGKYLHSLSLALTLSSAQCRYFAISVTFTLLIFEIIYAGSCEAA